MKHPTRTGTLSSVVVFRIVLPLLVTSCGALGQSDNVTPLELARRGDYREAARALNAMVESDSLSSDVVESLYYSWIRQGEYETAQRRFNELSESKPDAGPVRLAAARSNRIAGNYERALQQLEGALGTPDVAVAALHEKAAVLGDLGRRAEAYEIYSDLIRQFQNGTVRDNDDLFYIARSMWALELFHEANDLFRLVTQQDPRHAEAFLAWGDLLAEKYNDPEAIASYEDALRIDPNLPEAHLGMAAVLTDQNPEQSQASLVRALEVNPRLIEGFLLRARQHIDAEQYDEADEQTAKALEINPRLPRALSLLAATHYLRDDEDAFNSYVRQVLEINPAFSEMYYTLAELCVSVRLYEQAVEFAREALRLNERDWKSMSLLGINLLRIGEEAEGKAALERAYENDAFNVWTVNTLTLLDSFENFDRLETEHFEIKLHKEESGVLAPYVTELLEEAYTTLSAKYGFEPATPITFEMFPDHEDFAVRTLGLPGLGALGVSFGKVVVMDSPSARPPGEFNWGGTLWHEFAHVITLGTTDHKIPRWFSEGLSVYEERKAVPGWGEDLQADYLVAINDGQFLPIAELNNGFVRPTNPGQVTLSYYQASLVCDYIDGMYGFEAILEMLELYKEGLNTQEVFEQALGLSLAAFDRAFSGWVSAKVAFIDLEQFRDLTLAGLEAIHAAELDEAIEVLTEAIEMYPEYTAQQNPYEMLAEAYLEKGDTSSAIETLSQFSALSEYAYSSNLKLAGLMREAGDTAGAADILKRAMYVHPMDLEGHRDLGAVLLEREDFIGAAREYEVLVQLGAPDLANTYFNLASAQFGAGQLAEARRSILRCLEIAPSFEAAQELLLRIVR